MLVSSHGIGFGKALNGWTVCYFVFVMSVGSILAQAEVSGKDEEKGGFWVAAWKEPIAEGLWFSGSGAEGWLAPVPWMQRSGPYKRPQGEISFFADAPPAENQPAVPRKPVGTVYVAQEVKRPLLIFIPKKTENLAAYKIAVVDDDAAEFPFGSYRFQNLTPFEIEGSVGTMAFQVPPNKIVTVRPDLGRVENVAVKATLVKNQKQVPIVDTMWTYEPGLRKHLIFSEGPGGRGVELQSLVEYERKK